MHGNTSLMKTTYHQVSEIIQKQSNCNFYSDYISVHKWAIEALILMALTDDKITWQQTYLSEQWLHAFFQPTFQPILSPITDSFDDVWQWIFTCNCVLLSSLKYFKLLIL